MGFYITLFNIIEIGKNNFEPNGPIKQKVNENAVDFSTEQSVLDEEMKKRRERIEAWRLLRKVDGAPEEVQEQPESKKPRKEWTLDDDEDDGMSSDSETEGVTGDKSEDVPEKGDDVDPLDEFMEGIKSEVTNMSNVEIKSGIVGKEGGDEESKQGFIVISGEKKRDLDLASKKGEVMTELGDSFGLDEGIGVEESFASLTAINRKKELTTVDHSTIEYASFRKNFYVEVPELMRMTEEDVELMRQDLDSIQVVGKDCPKPIKRWNQCGISSKVSLKRKSLFNEVNEYS